MSSGWFLLPRHQTWASATCKCCRGHKLDQVREWAGPLELKVEEPITNISLFDGPGFSNSLVLESLKLWKILKEMGIPDHQICLLRNLYAGQKATVRTGHGTTDWFQIGKGVRQGCICHSVYLTSMQSTS